MLAMADLGVGKDLAQQVSKDIIRGLECVGLIVGVNFSG
jgi:hypothetical protein